ncbi:MAG TPA: GAF domain-containing protein, partial [Dehalococcoidales bacterium]|nr:GAF domain-containing protein [Dehalococcoidales bacterium]
MRAKDTEMQRAARLAGCEADADSGSVLDAPTSRRFHQLELLESIASVANSLLEIDAILDSILDSAMELVGGSIGGVLLMDKERGMLYYRAHRGMSERGVEELRIPIGTGVVGGVVRTGEPVLINDISRSPGTVKAELGGTGHIKGFMCWHLKRRDEIVGVIVIASHEAGKFGEEEFSLLGSVSDYLAAAVIRSIVVDRKISKGMARYQALLQYALSAQEDERKRIARELHDETSQTLTSLTFRLQAAIQVAEIKGYGDAKFKESLRKAQDCAIQAGNEIVKLMMDLRPTLLDDLGMAPAIQRYAKDTLEAKGIAVTMESIGGEHRLPAEIEVALFRVA